MNNGWNRGCRRQDGRIVNPVVVKGACGAVTLSGKVQIDVCLPGQNCSLVTLEVVWPHVRMKVGPVIVGNGRVARFVGGVMMMTEGTHVRSEGWSLDARKAGDAAELLSRGLFWSLELAVYVVRSRSGERKRLIIRVWTSERGANVLFPELAKVAELGLPRSHSSGRDSARGGRELIGYIDLSKIHENVIVDDALSVMIREEWATV